MPHVLSLLVLALAVSLDGFGVGAMYGLRKIRIPVVSVLIIAAMSGIVFFLSMQIGVVASAFFSPRLAKMMGAIILIGIGIWAVYQMTDQQKRSETEDSLSELDPHHVSEVREAGDKAVVTIELKPLGLVIQILKTPAAADMDRSGTISSREAAWLGLALSLDAFGAGIGAALLGLAPVWTSAAIMLSCGTFIFCGLRVGLMYSNVSWVRRLTVLPGFILILMGLMKLM